MGSVPTVVRALSPNTPVQATTWPVTTGHQQNFDLRCTSTHHNSDKMWQVITDIGLFGSSLVTKIRAAESDDDSADSFHFF
jgi:hypothetical protein